MRSWLISIISLLFATNSWATGPTHAQSPSNITILADEAMMLPLASLTRDYASRKHTPITVVALGDAPVERQIEQGLDAHVVITADQALLQRLIDQGLTDVTSRRTLARTGLALASTIELKQTLNLAQRLSFASIVKATGTTPILAVDEKTVDGAPVAALMKSNEFRQIIAPRLSTRVSAEEVITNLYDEGGVALLPATAVLPEKGLTILNLIPDDIAPPIRYDAIVLGSESMESSNAFVTYLASREAQAILAHYGYQPAR